MYQGNGRGYISNNKPQGWTNKIIKYISCFDAFTNPIDSYPQSAACGYLTTIT